MTRLLRYVFAVVAVAAIAGCAGSRPRQDYSALLSDWKERGELTDLGGPDAPERPSGSLPFVAPPPDKGKAEETIKPPALTIQPDCVLLIKVKEDSSLDGSYPVNRIGAVEMGYIGPIILFNKTEEEAKEKIREVLHDRDFKNATVDVRIQRASYDRIRVRGEVNQAGVIQIGAKDVISLTDALLRAGEVRGSAKSLRVRVIRQGLLSPVPNDLGGEEYDLADAEGAPRIPDVDLRNNDDVVVYSVMISDGKRPGPGKTVLVLGESKQNGYVSFSPGESCTMLHLLLKMGGVPAYANIKKLTIVRRDKFGHEEKFRFDASTVMESGSPDDDFILENGDRILIPARKITLF